jgi:hypothetical protein
MMQCSTLTRRSDPDDPLAKSCQHACMQAQDSQRSDDFVATWLSCSAACPAADDAGESDEPACMSRCME